MKKAENKKISIEKLLDQQTGILLAAVDERLRKSEEKMESVIKLEINKLADTLDKFLKRLTAFEDEFKIVKARLSKVEQILKEKLGVEVKL